MSKISNETRLILKLAQEKASTRKDYLENLIKDKPNDIIKGKISGLIEYETILNEIVSDIEKK